MGGNGTLACIWEIEISYKIFVEYPLETLGVKLEDNIKKRLYFYRMSPESRPVGQEIPTVL